MSDELSKNDRATQPSWQSPDAVFLVCANLVLASGTILDKLLSGTPRTVAPLTPAHIPALFYGALVLCAVVFARSVASETPPHKLLGIARAGALRNIAKGVGLGIACVFALLPVMYVSIRFYMHITGTPPDAQDAIRLLLAPGNHPAAVAAFLLYAVLLAPVCEELFYRCILLRTLLRETPARRAGNTIFAVALSSLFFGFMHLDLVRLPALTLLGTIFAIAFLKTKTLLVPIAAHITFNTANLALAFFAHRLGETV